MPQKKSYRGLMYAFTAVYLLCITGFRLIEHWLGALSILFIFFMIFFFHMLLVLMLAQVLHYWRDKFRSTQRLYLIGFMLCALLSSFIVPKLSYKPDTSVLSMHFIAPWDLKVENMEVLLLNMDGSFSYRKLFRTRPMVTGTYPMLADTVYFEHCKLDNSRDDFFAYGVYQNDNDDLKLVAFQNNTDTIGTEFKMFRHMVVGCAGTRYHD